MGNTAFIHANQRTRYTFPLDFQKARHTALKLPNKNGKQTTFFCRF